MKIIERTSAGSEYYLQKEARPPVIEAKLQWLHEQLAKDPEKYSI